MSAEAEAALEALVGIRDTEFWCTLCAKPGKGRLRGEPNIPLRCETCGSTYPSIPADSIMWSKDQ